MLYHLHVGFRPVTLSKLPHVYYVAVEDYSFGLDGFEVTKKRFRMTTISAKVYIGQYNELYVPFPFFSHINLWQPLR